MLFIQGAPRSYLRRMLSQWLQWGPGDGRGSAEFANKEALIAALFSIDLAQVAFEFQSGKPRDRDSHSISPECELLTT